MLNGNTNGLIDNNINPFSGAIAPKVQLFIFTPSYIGSQVIRPYVYNFNQNTVDVFLNGNGAYDTLKQMNGFSNSGMTDSIVPSANGISLDTNSLNMLYSFLLIIDACDPMRSMVAFGGPKRRTILTGYFIDEPINPLTLYTSNPTPNTNALMIFTHNNSLVMNTRFGAQTNNNITISANNDIVPQAIEGFTNTNLSLCDVGSLVKAYKPDNWSEQSIPTGYPIVLNQHSGLAPIVNDRVKSPKHQLIDIAQGVDQAVQMTNGDHLIHGGLEGSLIGVDQHATFIDQLYSHLQRPDTGLVYQGINPSEPVALGSLISIYPNVEMIPCQVPFRPEHDIKDQTNINISTVFSSLVSNSVSSYATTALLGSVTFRYSSWIKNTLERSGGSWAFLKVPSLLLEDALSPNAIDIATNTFVQLMESSLFPILMKAGGDFELYVNYDATGSTDVDLFFLDFSTESHGYFQTHNRLGGLMSPAVGTRDNANHNKSQLDTLIAHLASSGIVSANKEFNYGVG